LLDLVEEPFDEIARTIQLHRLDGGPLLIAGFVLPQHDGAARIVATTWNEFLPISMPITAIAVLGV